MFIRKVVRDAKRKSPRASGALKRSLKGKVKVNPNSMEATIQAEDYLPYIDQGVKGILSSAKAPDSPFSFKDKRPPARVLTTWAKRKSGTFLGRGRKGAGYALSNHIFRYGIRATKFFTKAVDNAFKSLPDELVEAYGLDIETFVDLTINKKR